MHFANADSHPTVKKDDCTKNYKNGLSHSPGTFTVQRICSRPKIFGIVFMDASEGLSSAMSAVLSRFVHISKVVYYDKGYNLAKSIALRCTWVLENAKIVCDRFHYKSLNCATSFGSDSYPAFDGRNSSNAEANNAQWVDSKSLIRYLNEENFVPFLTPKATMLSLRAFYKEQCKRADVEDAYLWGFGKELLPCCCRRGNMRRTERNVYERDSDGEAFSEDDKNGFQNVEWDYH